MLVKRYGCRWGCRIRLDRHQPQKENNKSQNRVSQFSVPIMVCKVVASQTKSGLGGNLNISET